MKKPCPIVLLSILLTSASLAYSQTHNSPFARPNVINAPPPPINAVTGFTPNIGGSRFAPGTVSGFSQNPVSGFNPNPVSGFNPSPVGGFTPNPIGGFSGPPPNGFSTPPVLTTNPNFGVPNFPAFVPNVPPPIPQINQGANFPFGSVPNTPFGSQLVTNPTVNSFP